MPAVRFMTQPYHTVWYLTISQEVTPQPKYCVRFFTWIPSIIFKETLLVLLRFLSTWRGLLRPFLADPFWVRKAAEGRADEINTCIGCNQACLDHTFKGKVRCHSCSCPVGFVLSQVICAMIPIVLRFSAADVLLQQLICITQCSLIGENPA